MTAGPLQGIRVLDLSRYIAGPHCAMMLGDMGADVVKVEKRGSGEDSRGLGHALAGESLYFLMFNRNKKSITLDFRNHEAQELLRRLAQQADVLVENFRPGVMEKMGCGWEVLREINPRLIMARLSGFGRGNSMTQEPCFDGIAQARTGIMDLTGEPGGSPMMAGTFIVDYTTALHGTIGILAALNRRHETGEGQVVDVDLIGSASSLLGTAFPEQLALGQTMTRTGNRDRYAAPSNTFRARDGVWMHIMGGGDPHFPRLARMIGQPELLTDPRFDALEKRMRNSAAIEEIFGSWVAARDSDEVMTRLREAEIPSARVRTIAEVVADPYMREAGHLVDVEHPVCGTVPMHGPPIKFGERRSSIERPPPTLGQHTGEVLASWLALESAEIERLQREEIV